MVHPSATERRDALRDFGRVFSAELGDLEGLKEQFRGVDTILHLAADRHTTSTWESLERNNITGTYHAVVAAKAAGCRRLIYASSIHAVSAYPPVEQVRTEAPVNPGNLYGVTKCFGEALGRYMAEREGLSFIAIRIGSLRPYEELRGDSPRNWIDAWVSPRDLIQLFCRCIDDEELSFAVFNGVSNNLFSRLDISDARELVGYEPQDDAFAEHPAVDESKLPPGGHERPLIDPERSGLRDDL